MGMPACAAASRMVRSDKNSLTETQKSLQEIVKNRYVYQKALLDEGNSFLKPVKAE